MTKPAKTTSQTAGREPPRIKKFRGELVKAIPRFPNDRASLLHMRQKHLTDLLIDYINWRSRYVGQRPRAVSVEPAVQSDPRWAVRSRTCVDREEGGLIGKRQNQKAAPDYASCSNMPSRIS